MYDWGKQKSMIKPNKNRLCECSNIKKKQFLLNIEYYRNFINTIS